MIVATPLCLWRPPPKVQLALLAAAMLLLCALPAQAQPEALLEAWQLEEATDEAVALARAGATPRSRGVAAAVLHQHGCHADANALLRGLPKGVYPSDEVRQRIAGSAAYAPHFSERLTPHFSIRYVDKDRVTACYAESVLEAAYANIGADLQFFPASRDTPIAVEIYPDAAGLSAASGLRRKDIATSGTIAICKYHRLMVTSPLALYDGYPWADTLAHELTHLIIAKKSANTVPVWLHEGIAKYFEGRWQDAAPRLNPYSENLLADAVARQDFVPFAKMHPSMALLPSQDAAALAFAEVFTTIEFVVQRHGKAAVAHLLERLRDGATLDAALQATVGHNLAGLEAAWKGWLRRRPFTRHPDALPVTLRLREAADAAAPPVAPQKGRSRQQQQVVDASRLGELLQLRGHRRAAWQEFSRALALATTPQPALLWRAARLLVELQRPDAARDLLKKLLAAQPEHGDANLLAGQLALRGTAASDVPAARRYLEAARLTNPYNPELHAALATLYRRSGPADGVPREEEFAALCASPRPTLDLRAPPVPPHPLLRAAAAARRLRQLFGLGTTVDKKEPAERPAPPT